MKLGCVVMAAGSSSRFGANKLLAPFQGKPLYQWALAAVPESMFSAVCVVTGYEPVAALAKEKGEAWVSEETWAEIDRTFAWPDGLDTKAFWRK